MRWDRDGHSDIQTYILTYIHTYIRMYICLSAQCAMQQRGGERHRRRSRGEGFGIRQRLLRYGHN